MRITIFALVAMGCLAGAIAASADGIEGIWLSEEEVRNAVQVNRITLNSDGGTWRSERGDEILAEVEVGETTVSFSRTVPRGGERETIRYQASLQGDRLVGTIRSSDGEAPFEAHRMPAAEQALLQYRADTIAALETCDILAVFAHPDDETFASGTIAKLAANGVKIQLVYATSGDAGGDQTGQGMTGEPLARAREGEMRDAAEVLRVSAPPVFLRYGDGFVRENWRDVLDDVLKVMERTQPEIVVTMGPDGYYGHRDHLAISQITGRAFDRIAIASHLLHVAIPRSLNDVIVRAAGSSQFKPVDDRYITYKVNVRRQFEQRMGAMAAHRSQFDEATLGQMRMLGSLTGTEGFVEVRNLGEAGTLAELFTQGDRKRAGE